LPGLCADLRRCGDKHPDVLFAKVNTEDQQAIGAISTFARFRR
jgi:hypothetical protein